MKPSAGYAKIVEWSEAVFRHGGAPRFGARHSRRTSGCTSSRALRRTCSSHARGRMRAARFVDQLPSAVSDGAPAHGVWQTIEK